MIRVLQIFIVFLFIGFYNSVEGQSFSKKINPKTGFLEIRSKLNSGIVVPWLNAEKLNTTNLAPIQSFIYIDGKYSDTSVNYLRSVVKAYKFKPSIVIENAKQLTVKLTYNFKKQQYYFGKETYKGGEAGEGYYNILITLWNNYKTITIEEELTYDVEYEVTVNAGLQANQGRYRGFMAAAKEDGYEPDGQPYRREYERGYPMDATVDFSFEKEKLYYWFIGWSGPGVEINTGRYWQLYNKEANSTSNLLGIYQGRPSKLLYSNAMGPRIRTYKNTSNKEEIELRFEMYRRGPDNSFATKKRIEWNVFIGTKNDLKPADKQQEIGNEMNYFSGLSTRINDYASKPVKIVPAFYDGSIYLNNHSAQELIKKVKTNDEYYKYIYSFDDGITREIWDSWRSEKIAKQSIQGLIAFKKEMLNAYTKGDGPYTINMRFSYGVRIFRSKLFLISGLFADKTIKMSAEEKKELESLVGLIARVLWDEDNVPIANPNGNSMGTANIIHQYEQAGRYFVALLLANDPEFKERAKMAVAQVDKELKEIIYENGSVFGSPHYMGAVMEPILCLLLQMKNAGLKNFFTSPTLINFAQFYLALQTPPSVRFGNNRKLVCFGDGTEESNIMSGLMAEGFAETNKKLSEQLYGLYFNGPASGGFHCLAPFTISLENKKPEVLPLTSSSYEGYLSNIRMGANTNSETALWCINGNKYFDHRNDDAGEFSLYALGAPLSLSRNSFYYPRADAAHIRSVVIPQQFFPNWNGDNQPINEQKVFWSKTELMEFVRCKTFTKMVILSTNQEQNQQWFRTIIGIDAIENAPVFYITDSIVGSKNNIWSMTNMSEGEIKTSNGSLLPEKKMFDYNGALKELPKATKTIRLDQTFNKISFTGQTWPLHFSKGINWDLYTSANKPIEVSAAQWTTTYTGPREQNEFSKSNGKKYEDEHQIIRVRYENVISTLIVPYLKNTAPLPVQKSNQDIIINKNNLKLVVNENYFCLYENNVWKTIGAFSGKEQSINDIQCSGGSLEIIRSSNETEIISSGNAGVRKVKIKAPLSLKTNQKNVVVEKSNTTTLITINQTNNSKNTPNGSVEYLQVVLK